MSVRLSLVMPAYNEALGLAEAVAEAHEALIGLGYEFELLVVDDGSTDGTGARVAEVAALWPRVRLVTHSTNLGYGAALRTGFEASRYDLVAFTDEHLGPALQKEVRAMHEAVRGPAGAP